MKNILLFLLSTLLFISIAFAQPAIVAPTSCTALPTITMLDGTECVSVRTSAGKARQTDTDQMLTDRQGQIDHDALLNFVADKHIAHTSVVFTAGTGLTGGGDITASRSFDVGGLTISEFTSPNVSQWTNDVPYIDASGAPVQSVNSQTGVVVLDTDDIAEGITNLYFTDERVDDRTAALIQNGTGLNWTYDDVLNTLTGNVTLAPFSTSDLSEGTNLYFTDERGQDSVGNILTDTPSIDFTYNDVTPSITADAIPGGIDHDQLLNYVVDQHVPHASVVFTAGVGLSGGGDISSNRTFTVDLNELTTETSIAAGDFIAMVDITDNGSGKITFANFESDLTIGNMSDETNYILEDGTRAFSGSQSFGDNNITNVGDISVDRILSDTGTTITVVLGTDAGDDFIAGSNALTVQGDTGSVGIGTATGINSLNIETNDNSTQIAKIRNTNAGTAASAAWTVQADTDDSMVFGQCSSGNTETRFGISPLADWSQFFAAGVTSEGLVIGVSAEKPLVLGTNDLERMRIVGGGDVGIGTTSPLKTLDVVGSTRIKGTATSVLTGTIDPAASTAVVGVGTAFTTELVVGDRITVTGETRTVTVITNTTNLTVDTAFTDNANDTSPDKLEAQFISLDSSGVVNFIVQDNGNTGFGTTAPVSPFHVLGDGTIVNIMTVQDDRSLTNWRLENISTASTSNRLNIDQRLQTDAQGRVVSRIATSLSDIADATRTGSVEFNVVDGASLLPRMGIYGSDVGIGTNAPEGSLHLDTASGNTEMFFESAANKWAFRNNGTTGQFNILDATGSKAPFKIDSGLNSNVFVLGGGVLTINENSDDYDVRIEGNTEVNLLFVDGGTDRVGIGTSSPSVELDVSGEINATGDIIAGGVFGDSNVSFDGGTEEYTTTKDWNFPPSSITLGPDVKLENNGGFTTNKNQIIREKKLLIGRTYTDSDGTEARISLTRLDESEDEVFQSGDADTKTISGTQTIDFVFTQLEDAFNMLHRFRGTEGLLTFDLWVAKNPADDNTLTDAQLIALPDEDKIQLVDGSNRFIRNPIDPVTGQPISNGTGNPDFWDFDDPNSGVDKDGIFYKSDVDFIVGRKLIIAWYSPDGNTTTVIGAQINPTTFVPYFETIFSSRFTDFLQIEKDADGVQTTDTTWTELYRVTPDDRINLEFSVQAKEDSGPGSLSGRFALHARNNAGTAEIIQNMGTIYVNRTSNQLRVRAVEDATDITIEVHGRTGETYDWTLQAEQRDF